MRNVSAAIFCLRGLKLVAVSIYLVPPGNKFSFLNKADYESESSESSSARPRPGPACPPLFQTPVARTVVVETREGQKHKEPIHLGGAVARGRKAYPAGGVDAGGLFGGDDENLFGLDRALHVPGHVHEP